MRFMKYLTGVYLTDEIARNGNKFGIKALEQAIWQSSVEGMPSHLDHDIHRLVAWSRTRSLFIEPSMAKVLGLTYVPENSDESNVFATLQQHYILKKINDFLEPHLSIFSELLKKDGLLGNGNFSANGIAYYEKENIVCEKYPFLYQEMDKDGLLFLTKVLKKFQYVGQGVFKEKNSDFAICLHPYFRRSYSSYNCYNLDFIDRLLKNDFKGINVRLKFDFNKICYYPSLVIQQEYDYWFGPNYDNNIENIPNGVTLYKTNSTEYFFTQALKTEFWWKSNIESRDGEKYNLREFEMEEVKDVDSKIVGEDHFLCKYVHSIYNTNEDVFEHFDGAVRDYDTEKMAFRVSKTINECPKNTLYTKIFRLDGKIPLCFWKTLITMYYRENSSVYEYFGEKKAREHQDVKSANIGIEKYIPYKLSEGDGIHLNIAYFNKCEIEDDFTIATYDNITYGDNKKKAIDIDAIDVVKELRKQGCVCNFPRDVEFYDCYDGYHCMPMIKIGGRNVDENLAKLITVLKDISSIQVLHDENKVYSYAISWCMEEKNIVLSFAAHIKDLNQWLKTIEKIPTTHHLFCGWLEAQYNYIQKGKSTRILPLNCVLLDGMLFFERNDIRKHVDCKIYEKHGRLMSSLKIPRENEDVLSYLEKKELKIAPLWIVKKMVDGDNLDYFISEKSSMKSETIARVIDAEYAWSCWTDK